MSTRTLGCISVLAVCLMLPSMALGGEAPATVTITATVDEFAEWEVVDPARAIAATGWDDGATIAAMGVPITASLELILYANVGATITPSGGIASGVLTFDTQTLVTSYGISGEVSEPDATAATVAATFFSTKTYTVAYVPSQGLYTINLLVEAKTAADKAPDAGEYTCSVVLTASWD